MAEWYAIGEGRKQTGGCCEPRDVCIKVGNSWLRTDRRRLWCRLVELRFLLYVMGRAH